MRELEEEEPVGTLLSNDRSRIILLNATLVILFATAWVSDRWPELTLPAILLALVVVVGQAILFYYFARKSSSRDAEQVVSHKYPREVADLVSPEINRLAALTHLLEDHKTEVDYRVYTTAIDLLTKPRLHRGAIMRHYFVHSALRPRASQPSTWALATLREKESLYAMIWEPELPRVRSSELAKWKVVPQGDEAFKLVAGAFEIEVFHGLTNIRILDSSRVTIEGEASGTRSKVAPLGIRPPRYQ